MTLPNLVIAGAPKCGTSSLYKWLADHPETCGPSVKETFYLMDEGHPLLREGSNFHRHGLEGYRAHFQHGARGCRVRFEATTHYLYQQTALAVLSALPEPPQIVFVLRKPSERVYSSFQYSKHNLASVHPGLSFSRFVDEVRRDPSSALIDECLGASAYVLRNDIRYSRYSDYLPAWVARFGGERVHVLLFEEMKQNARAFMQDLARRIQIDPAFYDSYDFPVRNETFSIRHTSLHRRLRKLSGLVPRGPVKDLMKSVYLKAQSAPNGGAKTPEDRRALLELEEEFRPYNQRLAECFGLDLSSWN